MTVLKVYAPTNDAMDEERDNHPHDTASSYNRHHMMVVMGDLKAKVGNTNTNREGGNGEVWRWNRE